MQGLEYHSFNVSKIADNGFVSGPLVMQGMLTAFRMSLLEQTDGLIFQSKNYESVFFIHNLIHDFDFFLL